MAKFNSPLDAFLHWEQVVPDRIFLNQPIDGKMLRFSFKDVGNQARRMAHYLKHLGFEERSHIALISKNCAHWVMADLAIMMAGYISIPIYPTLDAKSIKHILKHSESKTIIAGKLDDFIGQYEGMKDLSIIGVELYGVDKGTSWESIIDTTEAITNSEIFESELGDLHTIIYTSGTTGDPKGVMHTVGNFMESARSLMPMMLLDETSKLFSYLPMAHVAERLGETMSIIAGAEITYPESLDTFAQDLERAQPTAFFGVPRIYAKFQEKVLEKVPQKKLDTLLKVPIIKGIVRKKLQNKLGLRNAKIIGSAAAPISVELINWYKSLGIHILQLYGMTEDCCISHANLPNANKIGTVGRAHDTVQIKFSPEGEILIKNHCLFKGYYKNEAKTKEVFDSEGFFKTGDKGEYDHDGYLTIIGRAKDEFKTDKGKYVSPSYLELELSKNQAIETICVVGTGIPQPIALITLSEVGMRQSKEELSDSLIASLEEVNPKFEKHEKMEKVVVMKEAWTIDNGLITPSLKVRRNAIEKLHQPYYKTWFATHEKVIFE
ncbi:AMP-binding protein [Winogradskyella aurantiaca]|uniref:AMP-binding protein n=1 Tax=Winogradskyella aurantiaca TaxID=2219558 RepID=UPI000E1E02F3|nr:AMP-binding protein [Winogradskyella aurantiaca]